MCENIAKVGTGSTCIKHEKRRSLRGTLVSYEEEPVAGHSCSCLNFAMNVTIRLGAALHLVFTSLFHQFYTTLVPDRALLDNLVHSLHNTNDVDLATRFSFAIRASPGRISTGGFSRFSCYLYEPHDLINGDSLSGKRLQWKGTAVNFFCITLSLFCINLRICVTLFLLKELIRLSSGRIEQLDSVSQAHM